MRPPVSLGPLEAAISRREAAPAGSPLDAAGGASLGTGPSTRFDGAGAALRGTRGIISCCSGVRAPPWRSWATSAGIWDMGLDGAPGQGHLVSGGCGSPATTPQPCAWASSRLTAASYSVKTITLGGAATPMDACGFRHRDRTMLLTDKNEHRGLQAEFSTCARTRAYGVRAQGANSRMNCSRSSFCLSFFSAPRALRDALDVIAASASGENALAVHRNVY